MKSDRKMTKVLLTVRLASIAAQYQHNHLIRYQPYLLAFLCPIVLQPQVFCFFSNVLYLRFFYLCMISSLVISSLLKFTCHHHCSGFLTETLICTFWNLSIQLKECWGKIWDIFCHFANVCLSYAPEFWHLKLPWNILDQAAKAIWGFRHGVDLFWVNTRIWYAIILTR